MANTDSPFGLKAIGTTDGSNLIGKMMEVEFLAADSVACFLLDPVKLTGTTGTDGKTPVVAQAAAGNAFIGSVQSFIPNFSDEGTLSSSANHRAASTSRKALVSVGKDVIYEIQEDSVGGALAAADFGLNADIIVGAGSTITGISGVELDSSTKLQASGQLRMHRISRDVAAELGANANIVVTINEDQNSKGAGI